MKALPAQNRQLVAEHEDLQLLRPIGAGKQQHERKQAANGEVDKRPAQARTSQSSTGKSADTTRTQVASSARRGAMLGFANPTG
jgi:hypothetical protein